MEYYIVPKCNKTPIKSLFPLPLSNLILQAFKFAEKTDEVNVGNQGPLI